MQVTLSRKPTFKTRVVLLTKDETPKNIVDFSGDVNEIAVRYENNLTIIYCGLGDNRTCTPNIVRTMAAKGAQKAIELKRTTFSLVSSNPCQDRNNDNHAAIEGALLGTYKFSKYKSQPSPALEVLECVDQKMTKNEVGTIDTVCSAVMYARDCVNENASVITPQWFAQEALRLAKSNGLRVTVLDEKELARKGLHLIGAVGQGSATPPRLIFLEYRGDRTSKTRTALVGKGITFDSGGQNLKPSGHIETMRMDMAGGAVVLGAMKAMAGLKLKVNVVGCIAAAHNAIGNNACFPGDIYPSFAGKTVEICNTDAEGRLVLADAIAYCRKKYEPSRIIDFATLTGGILTALADLVAGLFSNDDALAAALFASGEKTGERLWRFPLYQEFRDSMKSDLADLRNTSKFKKGYASSITGAAFIQEFAGDTPWAHLDIAGTAFNEGAARGEIPPFATGFGVRLIVDFLKSVEK
jgi:leucyl aminopeptidase